MRILILLVFAICLCPVTLSAQVIEVDWELNSNNVDSGFTNGDTNARFSEFVFFNNGDVGLVQLYVSSTDGLFIDQDGMGAGGDNNLDFLTGVGGERIDFSVTVTSNTEFLGWTPIPGKGMSYANYDHPVNVSNGIVSFDIAGNDSAVGESDFALLGDIPDFSIAASSNQTHGPGSVSLTRLRTAVAPNAVPEPAAGIVLLAAGTLFARRRRKRL